MTSWLRKLEYWFAAVAFAEAGERETALALVGLKPREARQRVGLMETLNRTFAAAAFAEADCHEAAREILEPAPREESFLAKVGLKGIRVYYGVAPVAEPSFLEVVGLVGAPARLGVVRL
ncbi:MAG: hypothetical protein AB1473_07105 [Thermodesulfobacteriota bacterium]